MQSVIRAIYPAQCVACEALTEAEHGLCGDCWRDTWFIHGTCCDSCGMPLMGAGDDLQCDDCMVIARPWEKGRAALVYKDMGRRLALGLKHGDRLDLVPSLAAWMAHAGRDFISPDSLLVPVPLHWTRLFKRRYNQAAELAKGVARGTGADVCGDALHRPKRTKALDGHTRDARFAALQGAIVPHLRRGALMKGRDVVLVDDVMTSGATFAACAEAALAAGAQSVCVLALARVVKDA
jgi:predicted amidophosphoribosyltransferase